MREEKLPMQMRATVWCENSPAYSRTHRIDSIEYHNHFVVLKQNGIPVCILSDRNMFHVEIQDI